MKNKWILFLFLSLGLAVRGQSFQTTEYGADLKNAEELDQVCPAPIDGDGLGFNSDVITQKSAKKIVNKILFDLGIENQYKLRECKERSKGNAKAVMLKRGNIHEQYILYDVNFLNEMADKMSDANVAAPAAATFILAHEVGHHIKAHTLNFAESNPKIEMEADEFAAFTMAKIGYSLNDVLQTPRTEKSLDTKYWFNHPGRIDRMKAAFKGWMKYANNDSLTRKENASNIYNYHKEIEGYENQISQKKILKPQTDGPNNAQEVSNGKNDKIQRPVATKEEIIQQKEQEEAGKILEGYFKALGGMANVNAIKAMSFQELTQTNNYEFDYHYNQLSPTRLIISNNLSSYEGEQYKISNDSLYYRYEKDEMWKLGVPPGEKYDDPKKFIKQVGSSTGNFLEDFTLFSSPSLVALKEVVTFEGEQCHRIEVKEVLDILEMDRKGTGSKALVKQNRYYRTSDGLLHATERIQKIQDFKKNKPVGRRTLRTITVHKKYSMVDGVRFPMSYKIVSSIIDGAEEFVDQEIIKTVNNIKITQKLKKK